jgi:hypothetical protein
MFDSGQNWELFGYDMRQIGKHWLAAWRSLLWGQESPIRRRLDEAVCLHSETGSGLYQAGEPSLPVPHECEAVLLPEELVLTRSLQIPLAAEADIDAVLSMEVRASSPFAADDTGYGWRQLGRGPSDLQIALVIVSMSAVMAYLGRHYDIHDARAREVWADVEGVKVVVNGFGESARESRYRRRLVRCGAMVMGSAVLVLLMAGIAVVAKRVELSQLETMAANTEREAAAASRGRNALAVSNEAIVAANQIAARHPNPHAELARLTHLLGDDAYIVQFSMNGREMRIRGRAVDAAAVMETLTSEPSYLEVTAPQAIVKVAKVGLEQFSLNITLGSEASG